MAHRQSPEPRRFALDLVLHCVTFLLYHGEEIGATAESGKDLVCNRSEYG